MATLTAKQRADMARAANQAADEQEEVLTLTLTELSRLDRDELDAYLREHGVAVDWAAMEDQARQDLGTDLRRLDRGKLDAPARERLEQKVEEATVRAAQTVARQTIRQSVAAAMEAADLRSPADRYLIWISVGSGSCPSCSGDGGRHGVIDSADSWEGDGPGDGGTFCGDKCRCRLMPVAAPGREREGLTAAGARR